MPSVRQVTRLLQPALEPMPVAAPGPQAVAGRARHPFGRGALGLGERLGAEEQHAAQRRRRPARAAGSAAGAPGTSPRPSAATASGRSPTASALRRLERLRRDRRAPGAPAIAGRGCRPETSASPEAAAISGRENTSQRHRIAWSKRSTCEPSLTARNATSRLEVADWMRRSNSSSASAGFGALAHARLGLAPR